MFDILKTKRDLQDQIETQTAQIDTLNMELKKSQDLHMEAMKELSETHAELMEAKQLLDSAKLQLDAQADTVAELNQQIEVATQAVIDAKDDAAQAAEITAEKIAIEASRQLAASGHPPITLPKSEITGGTKQLSKAEFDGLTPTEKMNFARNGGRIVE